MYFYLKNFIPNVKHGDAGIMLTGYFADKDTGGNKKYRWHYEEGTLF